MLGAKAYSTGLLSQEPVDEDTSRVAECCATPRDSIEQGVHILPEEDKAKPVVLVTIFPKNTDFVRKIRIALIDTDDDNANNLVRTADTIFLDSVYLQRWKDPDKADQGGAGECKVLLDRNQRKTLQ